MSKPTRKSALPTSIKRIDTEMKEPETENSQSVGTNSYIQKDSYVPSIDEARSTFWTLEITKCTQKCIILTKQTVKCSVLLVEKPKSEKRKSSGRISLIHDSSDSEEMEIETNEGKERKWQLCKITVTLLFYNSLLENL